MKKRCSDAGPGACPAGGAPDGRRPWKARAALAVVLLVGGCGMKQGQLLYFMGVGAGQKVPAEFELTRDGPVLVLVDDDEERLLTPRTRAELSRQVSAQLIASEAAAEVLPPAALDRLRREHRDLANRGCREVGRLAGAHQVLWLQVRDFLADTDPTEASAAARMSVTVKVINAREEEDAGAVRLWPTEREGRLVSAELDAARVVRADSANEVAGMLLEQIAGDVAKLFYEHSLED